MANPLKGEVSFGPDHKLAFTIDALVVLENRLDKSIQEIVAMLNTGRIGAIRSVLWAGLLEHHPDVSEKEAGELILAAGGIEAAGQKVLEALALAFPPPAEAGSADAGPRKARPRPGTGLDS